MKVIIAGSRDITDESLVVAAIKEAKKAGIVVTEVVCGLAKGVDQIGLDLARRYNIKYSTFTADWNTFGKKAGALRNIQMGDYADALIAVRKNNSRGTTHMIEYMKKLGKPVYVKDIT